jgi:polysaccharide export outer membrane protein
LTVSVTAGPQAPEPGAQGGATPLDYNIGPADVLQIIVWKEPDLTRDVTVRFDGMVTVPLLGDLPAAGRTPGQLAETLAKGLQRFVEVPRVTVAVSQANSARFYVLGQVQKSGDFPLTGPTTVLLGTLSLGDGSNKTNLANTAAVIVSSGAKLHLNYSGTDTVKALIFGGIARPPGIYSAANSAFITGPGTLTVLTGPATDYDGWAAFHGISGGQAGDDDHDGLTNLAEYAFGLDPESGASAQPITSMPSSVTGAFTYTRRKPALTNFNHSVWWSATLASGSWLKDPGAAESILSTDGDVEAVQVTLSPSLLSNSKVFVRISATKP